VQGDVTNTQDLQNLFTITSTHFGNIDVLVANAGIAKRVHLIDVAEEDFDNIVNVNYRGLFFTVKHALDYLNNGASIILIASAAAHITFKRHSIYSSTKAAVMQLAKNFAYDLSDKLIRVNSISPGYIQTPIFATRLAADPNFLKSKEVNIPLKRLGTPDDIANAAVFLASEESSYVTGTDLLVDGGYCASFPTEG
jgi:NAD(P)-dependent dehydrogenase (short-subunit alcohol dehydrogenase family)